MVSHFAHAATLFERSPFFSSRVLQAVNAVEGVVKTTNRLSVLFHEVSRIELGVDHDCVDGGVAQQRLDHVDGRVVVQVLGCKDAAAAVWKHNERGPVGSLDAAGQGDCLEPSSDGLNADGAGVFGALQQVWTGGPWATLVMVPVITERQLRCAIETLDVLENLGEDAAQSVADRNHPLTIKLRRLDVQHVVEA